MNTDPKSGRVRKAEAINALCRTQGQGLHTALKDLLEEELKEAHDEMETAADNITIWRAQGRATELRQLLAAITPRTAG